MALAVSIILFRFLLGLVRYVLDFVLCVLVLGGVVAVLRPGPKDGVVSVVLAQLGAIVDPLYSALADQSKFIAAGPLKVIARQLGLSPAPPAHAYVVALKNCAKYNECQACVGDRSCGYFTNTGLCVPGGWLRARSNYMDSGDSWSYYHGQCYIGTRVEFVLLPSILGLIILGLAMVVLWRRLPARWCRTDDGDYSSCASSVAGPAMEGQRRHPRHHGDEHMPLLIDNDPCSLPASSHRRRASLASVAGLSIEARRHYAGHSWSGNVAPASSSLEEHYGSWCQRNSNMVQNVAPDTK
ncbi:hypothetical protein GGI16_007254 [Coemansia sp. S142-1]|nr:hypothetical protein GGI16_007254 [Coemansia sp. S142-1]